MTGAESTVPADRILVPNSAPVRTDGSSVVYWMIAQRRTSFNFALQRAADWARYLGRPLLIFEPLRSDYPWASVRLHRFIIDGMAANLEALDGVNVTYYPYVEPEPGHGRGLLPALAERACLVVTDHFPTFFLPRMVDAAAAKLHVKLEAVDSNGLIPLVSSDQEFATAYSYRRFLQRHFVDHLQDLPLEKPLFDLPTAVGMLGGTVSLIGGHGTAIAWAPRIAEDFGVTNAREVNISTRTPMMISRRSPITYTTREVYETMLTGEEELQLHLRIPWL